MEQIDVYKVKREITQFIEKGTLDARVITELRYNEGFIPKVCELWDYKRVWNGDALAVGKVILQTTSFYNTYGGYIIYGVDEITNDVQFLPVGIQRGTFDLQKIKQVLRINTGELIDISYNEIDLVVGREKYVFGILHIPKRPRSKEPVFFGKNGPEKNKGECLWYKDEAYLRIQDNCVKARSKDEFQLLFSERRNSFLWDTTSSVNNLVKRVQILDHNLPDRNFICSKFIGRDKIIQELWRWLGDDLVHAKVLAGDGGKGKTSIAYEFAEEVCRVKPYDFEKVIWLTAKQYQYSGIYDEFIPVPEIHYRDTESLLQALCSEVAILDEEIQGASIPMLKKILKEALSKLPCLIIIDDVDSTDSDQQKMILETAMQISNSQSRFLLTTRMNFSYSTAACLFIGGLEKDEYREFVKSLTEEISAPVLKGSLIDRMRNVTDGSPLFTESLLRLYITGVPIESAMKQWSGKLGSEVRKAALKREIDKLSLESRRILLATSYMRESSFTELKQITGYNDERMQICITELKSLFLLSAPAFIKKEQRFRVSNNTALLVLENADTFVKDPMALQKAVVQVRSGNNISRGIPRVGSAINQALVLIRENKFDDALATIDSAIQEAKNNPDLLLMRARCLFSRYKFTKEALHLEGSRRAFQLAHTKGAKKEPLFSLWYESELEANHPNGCIEVSSMAIENIIYPKAEWCKRRADAYIKLSKAHENALSYDASLDEMENAASDLYSAINQTTHFEKFPLKELLCQVHDHIWKLSNIRINNIPDIKFTFEYVKKFFKRADNREENFSRLLNIVNRLYQEYSDLKKINQKQRNLIEQIIRESEEIFGKIHLTEINLEVQKTMKLELKKYKEAIDSW